MLSLRWYGWRTDSCRQNSSGLILRGRRLVLEYTGGSPCGGSSKKRSFSEDSEESESEKDEDKKDVRRKSTIISFHCDKDPLATQASTTATYVGVSPDECSYHFEVLSSAACIAAEPAKQGVGPAAVFAIIGVIAVLVYFLGGIFYQRNVAHARGWRQLPNYSMWAGIGSFIKVSIRSIGQRLMQCIFPRVASVRDGILPTMEVRPMNGRKSLRHSRSSWESSHLS
jgi:cation-dependent mannose-6-phosphate receptor